jgi:hypothetical protein
MSFPLMPHRSPRLMWLSGLGAIWLCACRNAPEARPDAPVAPGVIGDGTALAPPALSSAALTISNLGPGMFSLQANQGLEVATLAKIERRMADGQWTAHDDLDGGKGYRIVDACPDSPQAVPACRSIAPGEPIVPVPWSGQSCGAQCDPVCSPDPFHAGVHRLVVHGCKDVKVRYEGPPFEMPTSAAMLARWRAASAVERVTISRLDARDPQDPVKTGGPNRLAGFKVIAGTTHELAEDLVGDLTKWMRAEDGFNDKVVRRCARGAMVGISLMHKLPRGIQESSALALDFTCNSLVLVREREGKGTVTSSFFDASRAELLSIVRRALPDDSDFTRLR